MAASLTPSSSCVVCTSSELLLKTGSSLSGDSFAMINNAATLCAQYGLGVRHVQRHTNWLARMATDTCSKRPRSFASLTMMDLGVCCDSSTALSRKSFRPASQASGPAKEAMCFCRSSLRGMARIQVADGIRRKNIATRQDAQVFAGGSIHEGNMSNYIKLQPKGDFSSFYLLNKV